MNPDDTQKFPEIAPDEKIGVTAEEKAWAAQKPPRPRVPLYVFTCAAAFLILAFAASGIWYYRKNVLPEKYYLRATAQFDAGNYREAFTLYEKAAKTQPNRSNVYNFMARSLAEVGSKDEALAYYQAHLKKQPGDTAVMAEAAGLYAEKKDYQSALGLLAAAAKKSGSGELFEKYAETALLADEKAQASEALLAAAANYRDPEKVIALAKKLMSLGGYTKALEAYNRFIKLSPEDPRGLHGADAAKAMLGIPTDPALIIAPGAALGKVRLGADKNAVKELMGAPERKAFRDIGHHTVEIWYYAKDKTRSMTIFFEGGKVKEIETRYKGFKTESALGAGNFLLEKNGEQIAGRTQLDDGRVRLDVKGGGLTFYAAGINEAGNGARFAKLIVHKKGEKPLGENQLSWIESIMGM